MISRSPRAPRTPLLEGRGRPAVLAGLVVFAIVDIVLVVVAFQGIAPGPGGVPGPIPTFTSPATPSSTPKAKPSASPVPTTSPTPSPTP